MPRFHDPEFPEDLALHIIWAAPPPLCQRSCPPLFLSSIFRVGGIGQ